MKLRELLDAMLGLDDRGFLQRFPHPFLLEEGLLRHETRKFPRVGNDARLDDVAERQVFPIRRRDGKPGDVALGRGALMDIMLDAQSVSSRHAVFKAPGDGRSRWCVVDTVSTNGTFVDGVRIATGREVELSEATVVRFGPDLRLAFYEAQQLLAVLRGFTQTAPAPSASSAAATLPPQQRTPSSGSAAIKRDTLKKTTATPGSIAAALDETLLDTDVVSREDVAASRGPVVQEKPAASSPVQAQKPPGAGVVSRPGAPVKAPGRKAGSDSENMAGNTTETGIPLSQLKSLLAAAAPPKPAGPAVLPPESVVVLACDPFAPLPLEVHRPLVIGRVPGNDFVLPNPQVSRRHCEVERVRDGVVVRDLKSANGTFYEDRRVDRQTIPFGGIFRIGPYALEVRCLDAAAAAPRTENFGDTMVSQGSGRPSEGLRGTFEDMPLAEMLSGVEFNQKTGVLDIQGDDGMAGFVSFRGGAPHQARCGKLEGERAILALLSIRRGRFLLRSDEAAVGPREVEASFAKVLIEHGRLSDEKKR